MSDDQAVRSRYRFRVQPLWDRDEFAILVFRDWYVEGHPDYRVSSQVLTTDDGWHEVTEGVALPMDLIPTISGYDTWHQDRMLKILDEWEQHIRDAVKADCQVELRQP